MIRLFKCDNFEVKISDEALTLKPYKLIWNRDRTKTKDKALQELGFIYFFCDPRSEYSDILDKLERIHNIVAGIGLKEKWKPDAIVKEGIDLYNKFLVEFDQCIKALDSAKKATDKISKFVEDIDLTLTDDRGKPIYTPQSIASTVKTIPDLVKNILETRRALHKDIEESSRMKGGLDKKILEDGINI